jgi:hypothetical protein
MVSGVALIVLTNVVALGGVIINRSGAPDSTLTLTQRELALPYADWHISENSGLALRLLWRVDQKQADQATASIVRFGGEGYWLDAAKLKELGIEVRPRSPRNADRPSYSSSLPADALLVLEMNGAAYRRQLAEACTFAGSVHDKEAEDTCDMEKYKASRLFVVDAGLDREALRRKYPDVTVYAIVRGQIEAALVPASSASRLVGYVRSVSIDEIQVPASMRAVLDSARQKEPFTASVVLGRRLEPWIVSLSAEGHH